MKCLFPNPTRNKWIDRYNDLVENVVSGKFSFERQKLTLHHIIPRSLDPTLSKDKDNFVYLPFKEHMDAHYYLWKADPKYGIQLWFGCVFGRKHRWWDLPGGEKEYSQLKKDVAEYRRSKRV